MAALGLSMDSIDQVFLSHPHWDHMGGLDSVLEANPALSLVLHEGFSKHLILNLGGVNMAISGCAHPGMEQIVERGRVLLGEPIRWEIRVFHLMYADDAEIARSVQAL